MTTYTSGTVTAIGNLVGGHLVPQGNNNFVMVFSEVEDSDGDGFSDTRRTYIAKFSVSGGVSESGRNLIETFTSAPDNNTNRHGQAFYIDDSHVGYATGTHLKVVNTSSLAIVGSMEFASPDATRTGGWGVYYDGHIYVFVHAGGTDILVVVSAPSPSSLTELGTRSLLSGHQPGGMAAAHDRLFLLNGSRSGRDYIFDISDPVSLVTDPFDYIQNTTLPWDIWGTFNYGFDPPFPKMALSMNGTMFMTGSEDFTSFDPDRLRGGAAILTNGRTDNRFRWGTDVQESQFKENSSLDFSEVVPPTVTNAPISTVPGEHLMLVPLISWQSGPHTIISKKPHVALWGPANSPWDSDLRYLRHIYWDPIMGDVAAECNLTNSLALNGRVVVKAAVGTTLSGFSEYFITWPLDVPPYVPEQPQPARGGVGGITEVSV